MSSPLTRADLDSVIERAVVFIRERVRLRSLEFALEVGEHLFRELYRNDLDLYHHAGRWSDRTLTRIAQDPRVNLSLYILSNCIQCFLAVREFGRTAPSTPVPALTPWEWGTLYYPLRHDPDSLVAIVLWISREDVSVPYLSGLAQSVEPYLSAGGSLSDLLVDADTPLERMLRLLSIVERRLEHKGLPGPARARTIDILAAILDRLGEPARTRSRPGRRA